MNDFVVIEDFEKWVKRRGPLGVGAIPERIFIAGWLAGQRHTALAPRLAVDVSEMRSALTDLERVAGLVKNQADNSGKTPYTDWACACADLDRARERAHAALEKTK